jgi:two-component system alkaline phosphatase synthesis response regulator PhoP
MKDILLVEDNEELAGLIRDFLERDGYQVCHVTSGNDAVRYLEGQQVKVLLLDIMLPGPDGYELLDYLRSVQTPVIFLTAKTAVADRVRGLHLGADDYITKPFEPTELVARVEAVLRRCGKAQGTLAAFDVVLDPAARRVTRGSTPLHLTPREFDLLEVLLRNRGIVLYREVLYERVWGLDAEYDSRTLDLHIQRLRKKLGWKNEIRTVFRVGYVLERGE